MFILFPNVTNVVPKSIEDKSRFKLKHPSKVYMSCL